MITPTDDGIHFDNSILWLDSFSSGEVSFISSAINLKKNIAPQVIATEETIKIFDYLKIRPKTLRCQYNRPFSIGKYNLELLPAGSIIGSASLFIKTHDKTILYAPCLQNEKKNLILDKCK